MVRNPATGLCHDGLRVTKSNIGSGRMIIFDRNQMARPCSFEAKTACPNVDHIDMKNRSLPDHRGIVTSVAIP
jgi:hypothetical protein